MAKVWLVAAGACLLAACASTVPTPREAVPHATTSGIDLASIDPTIRPQDDLYRYMNGRWLATTEIPPDRSNDAKYLRQADIVERQLRSLIEEAVAKPPATRSPDEQKLADLHLSFMDEARLEQLCLQPLQAGFATIEAMTGPRDLVRMFARFARLGVPSPVFYAIGQDPKVATQYIASLAQAAPYFGTPSGLGLPDRDYYLQDDPAFVSLREQYVAHAERMLDMAGVAAAAQAARDILRLETALARMQWTRVDDRDDNKVYNKFAFADLGSITPGFDWHAYLHEVGAEQSPGVIVRQPSYFQGLARLMREESMSVWRAYLKFRLLSHAAPLLSQAFVHEHFAFHGRTLSGTPALAPRWKRAVQLQEQVLGDVLGQLYVARHFPPESKARVTAMVANITAAYAQSIRALDWMSEPTRAQALHKLSRITLKVGYPERWKDYSALVIAADDLYGNRIRAAELAFERERAKLGAPIDRAEWAMTPQTFNAYYDPGLNEMVFPAAFLQPPFFHAAADDAVNYGGIGAVIGHEIGHGFDDQGSRYDGNGNLRSWWTDADRRAFEARTRQLIAQYDGYCPIEGHCVSGALTLGEAIGDLGGLSIAYRAYRRSTADQPAPVLDGFTGDQRFFLGWAQAWARQYREPELLRRLKADAHPPSEYRVNGTVINIPAFHAAFGVTPGDRMYLTPEQRVKIW